MAGTILARAARARRVRAPEHRARQQDLELSPPPGLLAPSEIAALAPVTRQTPARNTFTGRTTGGRVARCGRHYCLKLAPERPRSGAFRDKACRRRVERMNRIIKGATVKPVLYGDYERLRRHLAEFIAAQNADRRLKTAKDLSRARQFRTRSDPSNSGINT
ncbi:MAG: hypothetical protein AcusKO_01700 [Acuticoccus sp.]